MKVALLGDGKTGSKVIEIMRDNLPTIFNIDRPPTLEQLAGHDVIISFLPGPIFSQYIPLLLDSKLPVVTGSTDVKWPDDIDQQIRNANTKWIFASNFSLGVNLVRNMINILSLSKNLYSDYQFKIHEVHHTKKLDAPSGTALSMKKWLDDEVEITSERVGDVVGVHEIKLDTPTEIISLKHEALDRRIFAQGAIWAAQKLLCDSTIDNGLHPFEVITNKELNI